MINSETISLLLFLKGAFFPEKAYDQHKFHNCSNELLMISGGFSVLSDSFSAYDQWRIQSAEWLLLSS